MTRSRNAGVATLVALLVGWATPAMATPGGRAPALGVSAKLISLTLPAALRECTPAQAKSGGQTYANLWSTRLNVIDLASEKVYKNPQGFAIRDPRLSVGPDHSFHHLITSALRASGNFVWRHVATDLKLSTRSPTVGRGLTVLANHQAVGPRAALVLYAENTYDVSQGFFSDVARGCNLVGKFSPWATSAIVASAPTYSVVEAPLSSLVDGRYDPPGAMSLAELTSIVSKSQGSSTGPLPAGFKFPEIQGELFRNTNVIKLSNGKKDAVFVGWAKDTLPRANSQDPFTLKVRRVGNW